MGVKLHEIYNLDIVHEEMAPHVARWGHPTSVFTYVKDLDQMRAFVNERGEYAGSI